MIRGASQRRASLTRFRGNFLGRAAQLDRLRRWRASGGGLATLVGPPGAGKTRLAQELARHAGPAAWADLEGAIDPGAIERVLAGALGIALPSRTPPAASLARALATRGPLLVVLDGVDAVRAPLGAILPRLAAAAPLVSWLATARRPLGLEEEVPIELPRLSEAEALALFLSRLEPEGELSAEEEELALAIVGRIEALPLAVELVAGRARQVPLAAMLEALPADLALVRDDGAEVAGRTRLRTALDACWRQLGDGDREALALLAAPRGFVDRELARALLGEAFVERLFRLQLRSLVQVAEPRGWRMLGPVRELVAARTEPEALRRARRELAAWLGAQGRLHAERLEGEDPAPSRAWLEARGEELVAACAFALGAAPELLPDLLAALAGLLSDRGPAALLEQLLVSAVERLPAGTHARAEALVARGAARAARGDGGLARADLEEARAILAAAPDAAIEAKLVSPLATALRLTGDGAGADAVIAAAIEAADGDERRLARLLFLRAGAELGVGRRDAALASWSAALPLAERAGMARLRASTLGNLGLVLLKTGRIDEGYVRCEAAIRAHEAAGAAASGQRVLVNLAVHAALAGRGDDAESFLDRLDASLEAQRDGEVEAACRLARALLARSRGELGLALLHLAEGAELAQAVGALGLAGDLEALRRDIEGVPTLRVGGAGEWFQRLDGERVDLRRAELRRIFDALCDRHGQVIPTAELVACGWPGERLMPESGAERVSSAIRTLRRMGLEGVLQACDGGYRIDPEVKLARV